MYSAPLRLLALAAMGLVLSSCFYYSYEETPHPEVTLRPGSIKPFELELRKTTRTVGSVHNFAVPWQPAEVSEDSDWMYFDRDHGKIAATDIAFTRWRACPDESSWQQDVRGFLVLTDTHVTFNLEMPRYDKGQPPPHYVPWEHNGVYKLVRKQERPMPPDPSMCNR